MPAATPRLVTAKSSPIKGHHCWVTCLSVGLDAPKKLLSGSRDQTLRLWEEDPDESQDIYTCSQVISGHSNVVSGCALAFPEDQGLYAVSCSWDRSWCLWHLSSEDEKLLKKQKRNDQFNAVCWSPDFRQIFTASNKEVELWNTLGQLKYTVTCQENFKDYVSAVVWVPLDKERRRFLGQCSKSNKDSW
ncbi:unnamed protein product [Effrenium voratum]|nr:unnamed protein product [Effrenium voratum]